MKSYPTIPKQISDIDIYAFDKLDGSNIRAEWSSKRGFYKFGTRKQMIDEGAEVFGEAVTLIKGKYEKDIHDIMRKSKLDRGVFFFEFFGENSFAGWHDENDTKDVVLFDVDLYKVGLLTPREYLKLVGKLDIAPVLYQGKPNQILVRSVKDGTLEGMTFEGVVCKGVHPKGKNRPMMFKVKSDAWLEKLKEKCNGDDKLFEMLA